MERIDISKKLFQGDVSVWILFMLLCCFSIIEVFSATSTLAYRQTNIFMPIVQHTSFLVGGFILILILARIHYRYFSLGILLILVSIVLLILIFRYGITDNEAARKLDFFGIPLRPSEYGKLACIIYVAFLLSKREKFTDKKTVQYICMGVGPVCFLILPFNLSTAVLLGTVCFLMMFIGQIPLKLLGRVLLGIFVLGLIAVLLLLAIPRDITKPYFPRFETWEKRWLTHNTTEFQQTNNTYRITDDNYQIAHSKIAIARGGIFGKMPGQSVQRDFLPQAYSDFIYAIIIEELGIVGGIVVLLLYLMLMLRVSIIARRCEKLFPKYLVLGCGLMIVLQALIHMSITVGLFPVSGLPLPLISIGGNSILITCIYFGIILSVSHFGANMSKEEEDEEESEEDEWENDLENKEYLEENLNLAPELTATES